MKKNGKAPETAWLNKTRSTRTLQRIRNLAPETREPLKATTMIPRKRTNQLRRMRIETAKKNSTNATTTPPKGKSTGPKTMESMPLRIRKEAQRRKKSQYKKESKGEDPNKT